MKFAAALLLVVLLILAFVWHRTSDPAKSSVATHETAISPGRQAAEQPVGASNKPGVSPGLARELDPRINPYAPALKEAGKASLAWDAEFLRHQTNAAPGAPVAFALPGGLQAQGTIRIIQHRDDQLSYISGDLAQPETGKFFFLVPPAGSKAGLLAGVVEFWGSKKAYRVEPTGPGGTPEMWQRRLDEVLCLTLPLAEDPDTASADETADMPPLRPDAVTDFVPGYNSNVVSLQSYPGSKAVLLLDFFGGYTPTWGGASYPKPSVSNAQIKDLWKRVAEDYMPFNINVTTDLRIYQQAPATSRQKCVFTPSTPAMPAGAAGVAYIGSWDWGSDTVCWSLYVSGKSGAEVGAHEAGHTLNLGHMGTSTSGYFGGHGSGATGWAPVMGAGYYQNVTSWAKGEYQDANNTQDELNVIVTQNSGVTYRTDDTGNLLSNSRYLELFPDFTASAEGVIERTGDMDAFQFTTAGGLVTLTANPVGTWANLALSATLADAAQSVIASNNPQTSLSASISANLTAGTYTFRVAGAGRNGALTNGFSNYGSLGYYSVSGRVDQARLPDRFSVPEHAPVGTVIGTIAPRTNTDPTAYLIVSGNTGGTFAIDTNGTITVANNAWLDYNRLATNTMLAVQFELFVNLTNLIDTALSESNRRVVIAVQDINEAPVVPGFNVVMLEGTRAGTVLGQVKAVDVDAWQSLSFSLVGGNPNGWFAIDQSGFIKVQGALTPADIQLAVAVRDSHPSNPLTSTGYVSIIVISNGTPFSPGIINYTAYDDLGSGTTVANLTGNTRWPRDPSSEQPLANFDSPRNRKDNYGSAIRGFLIPPQSGSYRFWISSDDSSDLFLSATTNSTPLPRIAYISGGSSSYLQWTKFASQQSAPINLSAGQAYYLEARHKEGSGSDHLQVAWSGPATAGQTNIIPGLYLAPFPMNYLPHATGFTTTLRKDAFAGCILGRVAVTDVNPDDTHTFTVTSGSPALFNVDPNTGDILLTDEALLQSIASGSLSLQVAAFDSGSPRLSGTATVTINVASATQVNSAIRREIFSDIGSGGSVADLLNHPSFPDHPTRFETLTALASPVNTGDNYGSRIRALLVAPATGDYRFFVASDDASALYLASDDHPENSVRAAYLEGHTTPTNWTSNATQTSPPLSLVAGRRYYLEALHKEGGGDDHVQVGWLTPGAAVTNVIPASALAAVDLNYPPTLSNQTFNVQRDAPIGTLIGTVAAQPGAADPLTFKIISGNLGNAFSIEPATGRLLVRDGAPLAQPGVFSVLLQVAVQDSGYAGLYPLRQALATVTVNVLDPAGIAVWTGAGTTGTWSEAANWGASEALDGQTLLFATAARQTNTNDSISWASSVRLSTSGFSISGNSISILNGFTNIGLNTWALDTTLAGAQTWQSSAGTLSLNGHLTNAETTWNLIANSDVRLSGAIHGSGVINKSGTARLLLSGAHTFAGVLNLAAAAGTASSVEVNGTQDLDLGKTDISLSGRLDLLNHHATIGALNGSGAVFANSGTRKLTLGANDHSGYFSGSISNSSYGSGVVLQLVKAGSGNQVMAGPNTFSGGLVIRAGQVTAAHANGLGAGSVSLGDAATATNDIALILPTALVVANNITVPNLGTGTVRIGTSNLITSLNSQFSGTLGIYRDTILQAGSSDRTTFANRLYGSANIRIQSPCFPGRRIVFDRPSGTANDFLGDLIIDTNAVLQLGVNNLLGNRTIPNATAVRFEKGAQLRIASTGSADSEILGSLESESPGAGTLDLINGSAFSLVIGASSKDGAFGGVLTNSTGNLAVTKIGAASQVLSGPNAYGGNTLLSAGTLVAAHAQALGATAFGTLVSYGATLALSNNIVVAGEALSLSGPGVGGFGALLNLDGTNTWAGTLNLAGPTVIGARAGRLVLNGQLSAGVNTLAFAFETNASMVISNPLAGTGSVIKQGTGSLAFLGANLFSGPLLIAGGEVALGPAATLATPQIELNPSTILDVAAIAGGWSLAPGQRLQGTGLIRGPSVVVLGTLSPGAALGTLTFSGNLGLQGLTEIDLGRDSGSLTNDTVVCAGTLEFGGSLVISLTGPGQPQGGDSWKIFEAGSIGTGTFSAVQLPQLAPGLAWNTSQLAAAGILTVVAMEPQTPPQLRFSFSGTALTLSWPEDYTSYTLEGQTNPPGVGIGTQWHPVPDVISNRFAPLADPAAGSVYFRLRKSD